MWLIAFTRKLGMRYVGIPFGKTFFNTLTLNMNIDKNIVAERLVVESLVLACTVLLSMMGLEPSIVKNLSCENR